MNNSVYADYLEEALAGAGQGELLAAVPQRYLLDFASSAVFEEWLTGRASPHERGWAYRLGRDDGRDVFRATVSRLDRGTADVAGTQPRRRHLRLAADDPPGTQCLSRADAHGGFRG